MLLKFQCNVIEARAQLAQVQARSEKFGAIQWLYFLFSYTVYPSSQSFPAKQVIPDSIHRGFPSGNWGL